MNQEIKQVNYDLIWSSLNLDVLCILYYGRSGSVFFQSLLDGHEQVMMLPAATLLRYNEFWIKYENRNLDELISFFCKSHSGLFDPTVDESWCRLNELGSNKDENIIIDKNQFVLHLEAFLKNRHITRKNFFLAVHYSYTLCRGEDISKKKILVHALHTPHREDRIKPFMEDFPLTKMIILVRDPLKSLASFDRHNIKKAKTFHGDFIYELVFKYLIPFDILVSGFKAHPTLAAFCPKNQIRALRLEDIHTDSVNTLKKVVAWLGVDYTDILLTSTFGGKLWWGDISLSFYVNGFSSHIQSDKIGEDYHSIDVFVLGYLLEDISINYGYSVHYSYKGIFKKLLVFISILAPTNKEIQVLKDCFSMSYFRRFLGLAKSYYNDSKDIKFIFNSVDFLTIICCKYILGIVKFFVKILIRQLKFYKYYFKRITNKTVTFDLIK